MPVVLEMGAEPLVTDDLIGKVNLKIRENIYS